jgi:integrase
MPIKRNDRNGQWLARVQIEGRVVASKMFPPGRRGGPEWRAAKEWEEEQRKAVLENRETLSVLSLFSDWLRMYVENARRTMSKKVATEKAVFLAEFSDRCLKHGLDSPHKLTPQFAHEYLADINDRRGPHVANKARKHILAAWNWGVDFIDGFPDQLYPFRKVRPFQAESRDRYVPPDEDIIRVLNLAKGQDALMLATFIQTGARRGELFRLTWADVDLEARQIRLIDHKGGQGTSRARWLGIDENLAEALARWKEERPAKVENVFMQVQDYHMEGSQPVRVGDCFTSRAHFLPTLCKRAGVKPFGFHALRHKGAAIVFQGKGLNEAQIFMGHYRATTTDRYVKSAGLYGRREDIVTAINTSSIGAALCGMLQKESAPLVAANGAGVVTEGQ